MRSAIYSLQHQAAQDPQRTGGKGAGLARLHSLGFDVPLGFVITTSVSRQVVHHLGATSGAHENRLAEGELPAKLAHQLLARARKLGGPFAVRSSLVGEDSADASMAGQLATFLDVADEDTLLDAVKNCYASAFTPRLAIYRQHVSSRKTPAASLHPAAPDNIPPLAVVVQQMQPSQVAGVAFSADPVTGQRCVIVEAAAGRPDAVVSGRVNPVRWRVDARGVLVESSGTSAGDGLLPDARILELAEAVRRIAGQLIDPVDVEWLWDGERFWFLQARPISTLVGEHVYSNRLVADMSPGLIKPLLWSTNTLGMTGNVFGRIFDELLGPTGLDYALLARRIHSRLYTDMTLLGDLLVRLGLPANFFEVLARDELGERPRFRPSFGMLLRMRRLVPFLKRNLRAQERIRSHIRQHNVELERFREFDWSDTPLSELLTTARELQDLHGQSQWFIFLAALSSMLRKRILDRMVRRHASDIDPADLIRGLAGLKALEPNQRLQELAAMVQELPDELRSSLSQCSHAEIAALLKDSGQGRPLLAGFTSFMREYGFLSANGTDFSSESWVERPKLVWQAIAQNSWQNHRSSAAESARIRREARDRVWRCLHPMQRGVFTRLLRSTVIYLHLRERVSMLHSENAFQMRRVFLAMGRRLAEKSALGSTDDIFYLYFDELEELVQNKLTAVQARALVHRRRQEMAADAQVFPADTICGDTTATQILETDLPQDHLVGIGGSSGVVEGRARIVHDPLAAPDDLGPEDILVVPFTDVGWTPLFAGIGGIVAETGGQLSHTAIVAREYNLPAVVSVPKATSRLSEKDPITLDGLSGRVYLGHVLRRKEMLA